MDREPKQQSSQEYEQVGKPKSHKQWRQDKKNRQQAQAAAQATKRQGYNLDHPLGPTSMKLAPNVAGALSYVGWWITGLIFLFGERRNSFVRFHAIQSILTFLLVSVFWAVLRAFFSIPVIGAVSCFLGPIFGALTFVLWAGLIIVALLGKQVRIPGIGDFAARHTGQPQLRPELPNS